MGEEGEWVRKGESLVRLVTKVDVLQLARTTTNYILWVFFGLRKQLILNIIIITIIIIIIIIQDRILL